jgi:hypothetical protein
VEYLQSLGARGARIDGLRDPSGGSHDTVQTGVAEPHIRVLAR